MNTTQFESSLDRVTKKINNINNKLNNTKMTGINSTTRQWANNQEKVNKKLVKTNTLLSQTSGKLKRLANAYLGVMATKAMITTSDTITAAENKLNNINGKSLGSAGYNADGTYSQATLNATQETMDKMYASAQKVRMGYGDMMSNVSKSMTLAGGAFKDNIDNAIRFQEVMAQAYAIGGASAEEMSTSMYQMIQALGAGTLAGDELRSVREGAPLAYQAIEKFAQGVYNTDESLKDLASQGKITSDMVVAAIMDASDGIESSFAQTAQRFDETWTQIKNAATKAFEPVSKMMNEALNKAVDNGMIQQITNMFNILSKALQVVFTLVSRVITFITSNWEVISKILLTACTIIGSVLVGYLLLAIYTGAGLAKQFVMIGIQAVSAAIKSAMSWLTLCPPLTIVLALLALIIIVIIWVSDSFRDACGNIVGSIYWVLAVIQNVITFIINLALGLMNVMLAVCSNIGIYYQNAFAQASVAFWEWVQECLNGTGLIAKAVSKIAELFGLDAVSIDTKISAAKGRMQDYVDIGDAWSEGWNAIPYANLNGMFNKGYDKGTGAYDWVANKLKGLGGSLGLKDTNLNEVANTYSALNTDTFDPSKLAGDIGDTAANTGKIADSMELTEDDLKELRQLANMEWRKEYTTAHIAVHMNNKNTINNKGDLDNWVISLRDMLTEEIDAVANGVYA